MTGKTISIDDIKNADKLEELFKFACDADPEVQRLRKLFEEARDAFNKNGCRDTADKLLNASSRVYARETVVKYAIIHRKHQRLPEHFLKEERTT